MFRLYEYHATEAKFECFDAINMDYMQFTCCDHNFCTFCYRVAFYKLNYFVED